LLSIAADIDIVGHGIVTGSGQPTILVIVHLAIVHLAIVDRRIENSRATMDTEERD
jgi:hypothetical protein